MLEVDLQNSQFKNTSHVLRGNPGVGGRGTKKAHIARIGQMVAYFGRCLIVISKDKITSYHIWKIFLQSFSHELLVANGDDDGDYNMKTCREQNLRVGGKAQVLSEVERRPIARFMNEDWVQYLHHLDATGACFCDRTKSL